MKKSTHASLHAAIFFVLVAVLAAPSYDVCADEAGVEDTQYTWDLTEFYPSKVAWASELERLRSEVDFLAPCAGKLGDDAAILLAALEANSAYGCEFAWLETGVP